MIGWGKVILKHFGFEQEEKSVLLFIIYGYLVFVLSTHVYTYYLTKIKLLKTLKYLSL